MFLTSLDVFWPIAGVRVLVVQQTADAELFSGRTVPAGPVAGAGRLVTKDSVQPVTVFSRYWSVGLCLVFTVIGPPRVIASFGDSSVFAGVYQTVGTVVQLRLTVDAFPIPVTVRGVRYHSTLHFARILLRDGFLTAHCCEGSEDGYSK